MSWTTAQDAASWNKGTFLECFHSSGTACSRNGHNGMPQLSTLLSALWLDWRKTDCSSLVCIFFGSHCQLQTPFKHVGCTADTWPFTYTYLLPVRCMVPRRKICWKEETNMLILSSFKGKEAQWGCRCLDQEIRFQCYIYLYRRQICSIQYVYISICV